MDTSQPTRIQQDPLLPVPISSPTPPEAYQRAPTLMAGASPGGGGAVRVWAPSRLLLWNGTITAGLLALAMPFTMSFWIPHAFVGMFYPSFLFFSLMVFGIRALVRPCYITTDDTGIGVTTSKGSRAIRWVDIERCDIRATSSHRPISITFFVPEPFSADLTGYTPKEIQELTLMIKVKADLVRARRYDNRYVRASQVSALANAVNVGIGISFRQDAEGRLWVAAIEDHSPTRDAGLLPGDQVIAINNLAAEHLDEEGALSECRGPDGAVINLKISRQPLSNELEIQVRTRSPFG